MIGGITYFFKLYAWSIQLSNEIEITGYINNWLKANIIVVYQMAILSSERCGLEPVFFQISQVLIQGIGLEDFTRKWWSWELMGIGMTWMNQPYSIARIVSAIFLMIQSFFYFVVTVPNWVQQEKGLHRDVHNLYGSLMAKSTYEGVLWRKWLPKPTSSFPGLVSLQPNERPFVLTRAGFCGVQKYAWMWTGNSIDFKYKLQTTE
jgi:hypothetical protein